MAVMCITLGCADAQPTPLGSSDAPEAPSATHDAAAEDPPSDADASAPDPTLHSDYGVLEDEREAYRRWGWGWTVDQEPIAPTNPPFIGTFDAHTDLEADDLWQNIVMWKRTDQQGYYDLAARWADYYKNRYLSDYQLDLESFAGDHTFGWGLVAWSTITNDESFLAAANAIGDALSTAWYDGGWSEGYKDGFYSLRGPGRHLKLAVALGRRQWADDIWAVLKDSWRWTERTMAGKETGFWMEDNPFGWAAGATGAFSSFEFAVLNEGLSDYYEWTRDPEVKRRLVWMARWAQQVGLEPTVHHTGHWIVVDYPAEGQYFHTGVGPGEPLDPFYTCAMSNVLVRGYLLTGDAALLDEARRHWQYASKAMPGDSYPYDQEVATNLVGHFMNSQIETGSIQYISNGELPYVGLLFRAVVGGTPTSPRPDDP
jgi:hypothetical protein